MVGELMELDLGRKLEQLVKHLMLNFGFEQLHYLDLYSDFCFHPFHLQEPVEVHLMVPLFPILLLDQT